ncbi:MAG TPA: cytochrome c, partial [Verrucomicrobiae bacterium]|jgi:mono/diheme cytochrome c family protein
MGKPGQFPPLVGSEWVNAKGANRVIPIPLFGLTGPIVVKGQEWNQSMTAMGGSLSDSDIAAALSYVRNSWGNKAPFVTPEQVKAVRAELGNHGPMTAEDLKKRPEE